MKISFDSVLKGFLAFLAINAMAVTPDDVLSRDFFSTEPRCYLTENSLYREKPKTKLGKWQKLSYKDVYTCKKTGKDSLNHRTWKENEKIVLKVLQNVHDGYLWEIRNDGLRTLKTSLTTPKEKQKQTVEDHTINAYDDRLVWNKVVSTNYNETVKTVATRMVKKPGLKPLKYYQDESTLSDDEGLYFYYTGETHTATTNITSDTVTIQGQIKETGRLSYVEDIPFDADISLTKNYKTVIKIQGSNLTVDQEIEENSTTYAVKRRKTKSNYQAVLNSDGSVSTENETITTDIYRKITPAFLRAMQEWFGTY